MKIIVSAIIALLAFSFASANSIDDLMPKPRSLSEGQGKFRITKDLRLKFAGASDQRLKDYAERFLERLEGRTTIPFYKPDPSVKPQLEITTKVANGRYPKLGEDESYSIEIDSAAVKIGAETNFGAMRGLETLIQLLDSDSEGFYFPALTINDQPRFPWRGLMLDVARHYQPLNVIKRNIDAMAAVKLNVLHWHLTEDQGFRTESRTHPKLHQMGSDGLFYSQAELREIIDYAADRGIRVMPEFDMPGHATAWVVGHPEIASAPGPYSIERRPGVFDPTLDPTNDKTYKILEKYLSEMAAIFPDAYMHIGGDENNGKQWKENPQIQAFMKKNGIADNHQLQTYFNKKVQKILAKNKKIMMGWDEIFQPDLPKDVVIHSWRGQKALSDAAKKGYSGVLSNGYYIDLMLPASEHYNVDPLPENSDLTADEQKHVLGGEATMWAEWVNPETIDSRIWMRTAAIAERFWSPREVRDTADMYRRLDVLSPQLEEHGLAHRKNQAMMLRRLTRNNDTTTIQKLVDLIEPVKYYYRYQQLKQTMLDPFTGLIDAAQTDPPSARRFNTLITNYLENGGEDQLLFIEKEFEGWGKTSLELVTVMNSSPALDSAKQLPKDLKELSDIGLKTVATLKSGATLSENEVKTILAAMDEIKKPKAGCEFGVIETMRNFIAKAGGIKLDSPKRR